MLWTLRPLPSHHEEKIKKLSADLKLDPLTVQIVVQRLHNPLKDDSPSDEEISRFLFGNLSHLPDPFGLPDMGKAVSRLLHAVERKEKILFFGDYDVDGITGTAQMYSFFRDMGVETETLLPHRLHDGYGLTKSSVQKILDRAPNLVVTIDNGTKSREEITLLKSQGIDIIVVDHHETPTADSWPPVEALVNPKREDSSFAERDLASAGLVFLLLMALRARAREQGLAPLPNLKRYLDLACLGTIADIVPMTGTNRLIVKYGLEELSVSSRSGITALKNAAGISGPMDVGHVAFRLSPRINAAGRLDDPKLALDLLLEQDPEKALSGASILETLNRKRQALEESATQEATRQAEAFVAADGECKGLVVASEDWHLGVVGIVAAKLTERFGRPAVVLAISAEEGIAKGSARSVSGFSVHAALKPLESLMLRFGGHAAAAGMTVDVSRLDEFKKSFDASVRRLWTEASQPRLLADAHLPLSKLRLPLIRELALLEPHGPSNAEPVFITTPVRLTQCRLVGTGGHLKTIVCEQSIELDGIGFGHGNYLKTADSHPWHRIAFRPEINVWKDRESLQLKIKSLAPVES